MNAIALVVGNSNYSFETPTFVLKNPVNDARGVADALTRLGFFVNLYLDEDELRISAMTTQAFRR